MPSVRRTVIVVRGPEPRPIGVDRDRREAVLRGDRGDARAAVLVAERAVGVDVDRPAAGRARAGRQPEVERDVDLAGRRERAGARRDRRDVARDGRVVKSSVRNVPNATVPTAPGTMPRHCARLTAWGVSAPPTLISVFCVIVAISRVGEHGARARRGRR